MNLVKDDFYCGAFLSYLLNNNIVPALFEEKEDNSRRIYDFSTDNADYRTYVKSSDKPSSPSNDRKKHDIWTFPFTENQIEELKSLKCNTKNKQFLFVFVCGQVRLSQSKVAVVSSEDVFNCIDLNRNDKYKIQSIKIRLIKGHRSFDIYGTARADKKNGIDNTLKIKCNNIDDLFMKRIN